MHAQIVLSQMGGKANAEMVRELEKHSGEIDSHKNRLRQQLLNAERKRH